MFVYEKNLAKLGQIADSTIENIELFSAEQLKKAEVEIKRLGKALAAASKAVQKMEEVLPDEGLDTDPEE